MGDSLYESDSDLDSVSSINSRAIPLNSNFHPNPSVYVDEEPWKRAFRQRLLDDIQLMRQFLTPVERSYHIDKLLTYVRKERMNVRKQSSSRMLNGETSIHTLPSQANSVKDMRNESRVNNNYCDSNRSQNFEILSLEKSHSNNNLGKKKYIGNNTGSMGQSNFQRPDIVQLPTVSEETSVCDSNNGERMSNVPQNERLHRSHFEKSILPISGSGHHNGYTNVSVASNTTLYNRSVLNGSYQKGQQVNMSLTPHVSLDDRRLDLKSCTISTQLGSDVLDSSSDKEDSVPMEPPPQPLSKKKLSKDAAKNPKENNKTGMKNQVPQKLTIRDGGDKGGMKKKKNLPSPREQTAKPQVKPTTAKISSACSVRIERTDVTQNTGATTKQTNKQSPLPKAQCNKNKQKAKKNVQTNKTNKNDTTSKTLAKTMASGVVQTKTSNENSRRGRRKKNSEKMALCSVDDSVKSAADDLFGNLDCVSGLAAVSPGALLQSVKKTTSGLYGRVTPPTGMLVGYLNNKNVTTNASLCATETNDLKPANRKQLLKRIAKGKKAKIQNYEPKTSNYVLEHSEEIDRILAAAKAKTMTTPTLLKDVFRKTKNRPNSSGSEQDSLNSSNSEL